MPHRQPEATFHVPSLQIPHLWPYSSRRTTETPSLIMFYPASLPTAWPRTSPLSIVCSSTATAQMTTLWSFSTRSHKAKLYATTVLVTFPCPSPHCFKKNKCIRPLSETLLTCILQISHVHLFRDYVEAFSRRSGALFASARPPDYFSLLSFSRGSWTAHTALESHAYGYVHVNYKPRIIHHTISSLVSTKCLYNLTTVALLHCF